jgi:hypothetical protein
VWSVFFLGLVVYHLRTKAVSFRNFMVVLNIDDGGKILVNVSDIIQASFLKNS